MSRAQQRSPLAVLGDGGVVSVHPGSGEAGASVSVERRTRSQPAGDGASTATAAATAATGAVSPRTVVVTGALVAELRDAEPGNVGAIITRVGANGRERAAGPEPLADSVR